MRILRPWLLPAFAPFLFLACEARMRSMPVADGDAKTPRANLAGAGAGKNQPAFQTVREVEHGRIEDHGGLQILRLWGSPEERGQAHAQLFGKEILELVTKELSARFASRPELLNKARLGLPSLVKFPRSIRKEIGAMFATLEASGIDLTMASFQRKLDLRDLEVINAMDILAVMGCSGMTLWGDQVEGGGVLTGRNFDWGLTGDYMVDRCILTVQHPDEGNAFAAVAWPGYVGAVTGVSEIGVAVFLHVGNSSGAVGGGVPTALAAREVLRDADVGDTFEAARENLSQTKPGLGYITRVVLPTHAAGQPARIFESDLSGVTWREPAQHCVVTNHFLSKPGARSVSSDSQQRREQILDGIQTTLKSTIGKVAVHDVWKFLRSVDREGGFGTLHSLVFRHQPWIFELAIGEMEDGGVKAATRSSRKYRLTKAQVFDR